MAKELARERKIVADGALIKGTIQDPRRYAYLEGCGVVGDNALSFSLRVGDEWIASDRGNPEFRIVRDGCFRAAVPLPPNATVGDVRGVRVQAYERQNRRASTPIRFTRLNTLFGLDDQYVPGPPLVTWVGAADLSAGGPPLEIPVP
jgi:hypothetical protein